MSVNAEHAQMIEHFQTRTLMYILSPSISLCLALVKSHLKRKLLNYLDK